MKNLKEIKTTVIGAILFLLSLAIGANEYLYGDGLDYIADSWVFGMGLVGMLFVVASDRIIDLIFDKLKKKSE